MNEFSERRFHEAKLSNIIKEAGIPRGSFYQYFDDKLDLYKYLFNIIGQKKISYMTDDLKNPYALPFFDLFRTLYKIGLRFALDHPKYVKIAALMLASKDLIYQEVFGENIQIAKNLYIDLIKRDQEEGRMDKHIDPETLADIVINMTTNVMFDQPDERLEKGVIDFEEYNEKINKVIYIFEKGITGK